MQASGRMPMRTGTTVRSVSDPNPIHPWQLASEGINQFNTPVAITASEQVGDRIQHYGTVPDWRGPAAAAGSHR